MGLLGDIYSTIDSKKRQLKGLLADPVETLKLGLLNFKNDQNALLDTQAQAYSFIPRTQDQQARIPTFTRTQEQARKELADQGANMGMAAATVWHGSPHKFDKFDSSKIGTGEGAQAYGHGLYLAESPKVATEYSKMGSGAGGPIPSPLRFVNGQEVQPGTGSYKAASLLDSMSVAQAKKTVNGWLKSARPEEVAYFQDVSDTLAGIGSKSAVKQKAPGGSLYKVDLPDEHIAKMLDWDKPLSQQPEIRKMVPKELEDILSTSKDIPWTVGKTADEFTGQDLYRAFSSLQGTNQLGTNVLKDAGIPGIRYLDGGSRSAGAGSSNFVVFPGNENLLTILERNGQGLLGQ